MGWYGRLGFRPEFAADWWDVAVVGGGDPTGVSAFEAKMRLVRDAVRSYLIRPFITLPKPSTA